MAESTQSTPLGRALRAAWKDADELAQRLRKIEVSAPTEHKERVHDAACGAEEARSEIDLAIRAVDGVDGLSTFARCPRTRTVMADSPGLTPVSQSRHEVVSSRNFGEATHRTFDPENPCTGTKSRKAVWENVCMNDTHKCYGADLDQHGERCYCGAPAVCHVYYGTGCGNACAKHAQRILKIKRLPGDPKYIRWIETAVAS